VLTCYQHGHEVVPQLLVVRVSTTHVHQEAKEGRVGQLGEGARTRAHQGGI